MSTSKPTSQSATPKPGKPAPTREERLKAALKANMGRRKAQARARTRAAADDDQTES
jgi:hypothetical protein